jgi:hypothetical protein
MTYRSFTPTANSPQYVPPLCALPSGDVVVVVGDSIATYNANTTGRGDGPAQRIEAFYRNRQPTVTFHNRAIGSQTYQSFFTSTDTAPLAPDLVWWAGAPWKQQVRDLGPNVLYLMFGMNEGAGIRPDLVAALLDEIATWPSAPRVVLCTNVLPSFADGQRAPQEGRDIAAGITRTLGRYRGLPVLDFHRQFCAARDAFDPCESTYRNIELPGVLATDRRKCPEETIDFIAEFDVNMDALIADKGGDKVVVRIGSMTLDWLRISKKAGPQLRLELSSGPGANPYCYREALLPWQGGQRTYRVEVKDNILTMYEPNLGGPEGTNQPALFTSKVIRGGGWFTPFVSTVEGVADIDQTVTNVSFWTAEQRVHRPTITDGEIYQGAAGLFEGSLVNHPGNKAGAFIYAPVLAQAHI